MPAALGLSAINPLNWLWCPPWGFACRPAASVSGRLAEPAGQSQPVLLVPLLPVPWSTVSKCASPGALQFLSV